MITTVRKISGDASEKLLQQVYSQQNENLAEDEKRKRRLIDPLEARIITKPAIIFSTAEREQDEETMPIANNEELKSESNYEIFRDVETQEEKSNIKYKQKHIYTPLQQNNKNLLSEIHENKEELNHSMDLRVQQEFLRDSRDVVLINRINKSPQPLNLDGDNSDISWRDIRTPTAAVMEIDFNKSVDEGQEKNQLPQQKDNLLFQENVIIREEPLIGQQPEREFDNMVTPVKNKKEKEESQSSVPKQPEQAPKISKFRKVN